MNDELQKTALPLGAAAGAAARFLLPKLIQGGRALRRIPDRDLADLATLADDIVNDPAPQEKQAPELRSVPAPPLGVDRIGNLRKAVIRDSSKTPKMRGA